MTRSRASVALFWVAAAALVVVHAIVAWHSLVVWRLWEDEAFNLTVPLNLLAGYGYTSDGALSGSTLTPFDARISTGPAVLLPVTGVLALGVDPVIGARLVPLTYWVLLLAGLFVLGRRVAGRWAGLVAVAVPLAFDTTQGYSPIQGPADLLGEIPAAALLVWALVVLPRRGWLAGLLVGLAVQAKLIALLALPAFAVAVWMLLPGLSFWKHVIATLRRGWLPLVMVGVPTLLFEIWAFASLGVDGFMEHLRQLRDFVRGGGQNVEPTSVADKLTLFVDSWFVPGWLVIAVIVVPGVAVVAALAATRSVPEPTLAVPEPTLAVPEPAEGPGPTTHPAPVLTLLAPALIGLLAFVGWWSTASHLPLWVRHPAVGVFAFAPLLAVCSVWSIRSLWARRDARRMLAGLSAALIVVSCGWGIAVRVADQFEPRSETLLTQRAEVAPIAEWVEQTDTEWLAAYPWGAAVAPIVLSGAHVGLWDAPAMDAVPRLTGRACETEQLVTGGRFQVCAAD